MNQRKKLYIPPFTGELIRTKREDRRLKQSEVAEMIGMDRSRLSKIERGLVVPSERELQILEILQISRRDYQQTVAGCRVLDGKGFRGALSQNYLPPRKEPSFHRLLAARKTYPEAMAVVEDKLARRQDRDDIQCFARDSAFDSGFEIFSTFRILELPSVTGWAAPLAWNFRERSVIDKATMKVVGDLRFPAIYLTELKVILIGQVRLDVPDYPRLDFLAGVKTSAGIDWVDVEFDGPGHDGRRDVERRLAHGLREARFREEHVCASSFHDDFVESLLQRPPAHLRKTG